MGYIERKISVHSLSFEVGWVANNSYIWHRLDCIRWYECHSLFTDGRQV